MVIIMGGDHLQNFKGKLVLQKPDYSTRSIHLMAAWPITTGLFAFYNEPRECSLELQSGDFRGRAFHF